MEFFNDIIGTLPYMDFSDSETISFDNPNGLPIGKNAIFKVKVDKDNSGTIFCFDEEFYRIKSAAIIEKWEINSWKEFYNSKANNALKIYKYVSENEEPYYGWVDFNGVNSYSVGDVQNPIGYANHANTTPISGEWKNTTKEVDEWNVEYQAARIPRNGICLLKINFGNISFISLINYIELNAVTKEAKYTYLQTIRWTDGGVIISRPIYAKHMWLSSGNKVAVVFGDFSSDNSFTKDGYLEDFQYKIIT